MSALASLNNGIRLRCIENMQAWSSSRPGRPVRAKKTQNMATVRLKTVDIEERERERETAAHAPAHAHKPFGPALGSNQGKGTSPGRRTLANVIVAAHTAERRSEDDGTGEERRRLREHRARRSSCRARRLVRYERERPRRARREAASAHFGMQEPKVGA